MDISTILVLGFTVFCTGLISGTFGMAGGMVLMIVLLHFMPLETAFFFHASTQLVSNGWRCFMWRKHIVWRALPWWAAGVLTGLALVISVHYIPSKTTVLFMLGTIPLIGLGLRRWVTLSILKPAHAYFCAICLSFVHLTGGVVGALLDLLFNNTPLTRHQIISTKAFTQTCSHTLRLVYFGALLPLLGVGKGWPEGLNPAVLPLMMIMTVAGTSAAALALRLFDDDTFKRNSRYIIACISVYCLARAFAALWAGSAAVSAP
jgi:uncharacterized membrane protein YfcA